jgi:hypothetical protein
MKNRYELLLLKIFNVIAFIIMLRVNFLANSLPINGLTSGKVSDSYPNLFAPAGITFSIWGVIYLLLGIFVIYQLGFIKETPITDTKKKISLYFIISSFANAAWIFSWHYQLFSLSVAIMSIILISLIAINNILNTSELNTKDKIFVKLPFSIYFGWITVAAIANVTTLLVSLGWNRWGFSEEFWTIIILFVGVIIGVITTIKNKDIAYGLVIFWAYTGILIKHISSNGFDGKYPEIIFAVGSFLFIILISTIYVAIKKYTFGLKK